MSKSASEDEGGQKILFYLEKLFHNLLDRIVIRDHANFDSVFISLHMLIGSHPTNEGIFLHVSLSPTYRAHSFVETASTIHSFELPTSLRYESVRSVTTDVPKVFRECAEQILQNPLSGRWRCEFVTRHDRVLRWRMFIAFGQLWINSRREVAVPNTFVGEHASRSLN